MDGTQIPFKNCEEKMGKKQVTLMGEEVNTEGQGGGINNTKGV